MQQENTATITGILNTDYLDYAKYVVLNRAIPSFIDGFKPVQRKVFHIASKHCNNRLLKVSALTGYVMSPEADYHHGDTSSNSAAIVMAQEFMQAMPYLDKSGQFGYLYDRIAGAPRYIKVQLSGWSKLLFKDDAELIYNIGEEGNKIEPRFYLPILPMMLLNGTNGIAVGYSSSFANRNPLEVALATKEYLTNKKLPEYQLTPFVNGHCGIWSYYHGVFEHCAPFHRKHSTCISIDGLPIDTTEAKFQGYLNELIEQNLIVKYDNLTSNGRPCFEVHMRQVALDKLIEDNAVAGFFRLICKLPKDNMTCVMPDASIRRFESPIEFIKEFTDFRLKFYEKRRQRLMAEIQARLTYLDSLIRFIRLVVNQEIDLRGKNRKTLELELQGLGIIPTVLQEHLYNLTEDNIRKHENEIAALNKELKRLQNTTDRKMYIDDITELIGHISKHYKIEDVLNVNNEKLLRIS